MLRVGRERERERERERGVTEENTLTVAAASKSCVGWSEQRLVELKSAQHRWAERNVMMGRRNRH